MAVTYIFKNRSEGCIIVTRLLPAWKCKCVSMSTQLLAGLIYLCDKFLKVMPAASIYGSPCTGACVVKKMLAMYLKYHKAGLTPTTPVTSTSISPVKMSMGRKSLTNLRSEMIFLQGKPFFYIFLPSKPPY
jgi:hypothetical protein